MLTFRGWLWIGSVAGALALLATAYIYIDHRAYARCEAHQAEDDLTLLEEAVDADVEKTDLAAEDLRRRLAAAMVLLDAEREARRDDAQRAALDRRAFTARLNDLERELENAGADPDESVRGLAGERLRIAREATSAANAYAIGRNPAGRGDGD